jgi:predicted transposase/invertase (TIGR01784 family)
MRFFSFGDEDQLDVLATKDSGIKEAVKMLKYMSEEESLYILEQSREKYEWDVASRIHGAREEGVAKGRAEGVAEGEARGEYEGILRVAHAALAKGMSLDVIMDITGLDAETIKRLQEN